METTGRLPEAFAFTIKIHTGQLRKGTAVPYFAHLLGVCALVITDGGDEDEAIAALLHDAVEDQGGLETLNEIRRRFGDRVADIVDGCTDSYTVPKPPWRQRKERYLDHLPHATREVQRVSLADKLDNARSILMDLRQHGDAVWRRFRGGRDGTLWYYRSLVKAFRYEGTMLAEFERVVQEIEALVAVSGR